MPRACLRAAAPQLDVAPLLARAPLMAVSAVPTPGELIVLAGGRSGGHVFPALAVAEELARLGYRLAWIGAPGSIEQRLVEARGLVFHAVRSAPLVGRGAWGRVRALAVLSVSSLRAWRLLRRLGARAVLGTGGFVSAPAVLGAWLARIPTLLLEPNARAGVANRLLSRFASLAAIAHDETATELRCATVLTGVPVRSGFDAESPTRSGPETRILILGGSQGAQAINRVLPGALKRARETPLAVVHQTGEAHLDQLEQQYRTAFGLVAEDQPLRCGAVKVHLVAFIEDMAAALRNADLVISRAGAVTLAELCAAGRGALLVPLDLAGGHQRDNAEAMAAAGAARVVGACEEDLAAALEELTTDRATIAQMGRQARALAHPEASRSVACEIERLVEARRR